MYNLTFIQKVKGKTLVIPFRRDIGEGEGFNTEAVRAFTRKANVRAKNARVAAIKQAKRRSMNRSKKL